MSLIVDGTTGVTFNDSSLQGAAASPNVLKNRIINGAMVIDQRNAGASVTQTTAALYTIDRWAIYGTVASKFTAQQNAASVTPPAGFTNYLGITSSSAYSVGSTDAFVLGQKVEGFNISDLAWGTASAKTITLSFWVRSSLTGTFGGSIVNNNFDRAYPFTYTISSANTWEQKSITIAGDTTGTWLTTNGLGLTVWVGLGAGSALSGTAGSWQASGFYSATGATSVVGTNGATFYITGVQLEQNTSATPFERRLYNQELANCQRYFQKNTLSSSFPGSTQSLVSASGGNLTVNVQCPVYMRVASTVETNLTNANYTSLWSLDVAYVTGNVGKTGTVTISPFAGTNSYGLALTGATWASTPNLFYPISTGYISASAEL
jgi:hypothetical protein